VGQRELMKAPFLGTQRERGARRCLVRHETCAVGKWEGVYGTASMRFSATSASRGFEVDRDLVDHLNSVMLDPERRLG
jgi:hypothetical protein